MTNARRGGIARARSLTPAARSRIASVASQARWRRSRGVLRLGDIRREVAGALRDRDAVAYLFGSYARGEARRTSDVDIMVVERVAADSWLHETAVLRKRISLGRAVDLVVVDRASFDAWRNEVGTLPHVVAREGVRLV